MTFYWREHQEAHDELREAVFYLEQVREGWGDKFADAVEAAIESIVESPYGWSFHHGRRRSTQIRTRSVAGFRYSIKS